MTHDADGGGEHVDIAEILTRSGLSAVDQRRVHNALVNNEGVPNRNLAVRQPYSLSSPRPRRRR
jgi:hypothetical protein